MRRLSAMDALFLYNEEFNPGVHQHTIKVSVIGPGPSGEYSFERAKAQLGERLHRLPPFRWRIVRVPGDLHHPFVVEDPDFDLDFHVRRLALPAPGGMRELCEVVGDIASRPLDHSKPLWEIYLVEGLHGDRLVSVAKVHHALADGVASAELLDLFYDASAEGSDPGVDDWQPGRVPSSSRALLGAVPDLARMLRREVPGIVRTTRRVRAARKSRSDDATVVEPPKPFEAPAVSFNRFLTPHRSFTLLSVPLADVRAVKSAFGTTINDVVLATAAGGLRRYLERRGELPDRPLVGSVPVSTRPPEERLTWGNKLSKIYVSLPVDVADPLERLQAARDAAMAAKSELAMTSGARIENWLEYMPVPLMRLIGHFFNRQLKAGKPTENLVVSNVPGPKAPLWIGGAPVESFFSVGPLTQGVGLNITAWSYVDEMNVCLLACREAVPDLWELTDDVHAAFDELLALATAAPARPKVLT